MTSEEKDMGNMYWSQCRIENFFSRKNWRKKHIRDDKTCANGSNIAKHAWSFGHRIDFDNSCVIDKGSFRIKKKKSEAWHTSATKHVDNNSKMIPNQYNILFKNSHEQREFTFDDQSWKVVFLFLVTMFSKRNRKHVLCISFEL